MKDNKMEVVPRRKLVEELFEMYSGHGCCGDPDVEDAIRAELRAERRAERESDPLEPRDVARKVAFWHLGDPNWADKIIDAFLDPETAMWELRLDMGLEEDDDA